MNLAVAIQMIFFLAALWIFYTYAGYAILIWLRQRLLRPRKGQSNCTRSSQSGLTPQKVSVIVAVHNGEGLVEAKIADCLGLDWPGDSLEILVADDASTDATAECIRDMADPRVLLIAGEAREGKEAAQKRAIAIASGEVLVFTDAGVRVSPGALRYLLPHFADPRIGCVSGIDRTLDPAAQPSERAAGESLFVRYDTWLKRQESLGGSCVGNSGWLFAVRRALCGDWHTEIPSDLATALKAVRAGYRGIIEPEAVATGEMLPSDRGELRRKVRTIVRGMAALAAYKDLLNPFRYGFFALQLLSHKILRWLLPVPILTLYVCSALLRDVHFFYAAVFLSQSAFFLMGITTSRFSLPRFLALANIATLLAWWQYFRGHRYVVWQPTARQLRDEI